MATDAAGNANAQAVTLNVNDLDEVAPTITSGAVATTIDENSGAGQVIYTASSTDNDDITTGTTSYSLSGADASLLSINASTGAVALIASPNFESKAAYAFNVVATDAAGNANAQAVTLNVNDLDEVPPVITAVSIPNEEMKVNDVVTVTITVVDDEGDAYSNLSGTIGGFALSNLTRTNNTTYSAQFTITNNGNDVAAGDDIPVSLTLNDSVGNTSPRYSTAISQDNDLINAKAPIVTDNNIQISGASGTDGAFKVGDTVTVQWNNTSGGDNNDDISAVTVDFSAFGGGKAVAAAVFEQRGKVITVESETPVDGQSNGVSIWQATYVITEAEDGIGSDDDRKISNETIIDAANLNVSVTATDNAGNATTTADTTNATVDNESPDVTDNNIQIFGASGTDGAFKVGDTVTVQWNNTSGGNNNDDISAVTVDFSAFGGGKAVAAAVFEQLPAKSSLNSLESQIPVDGQSNGVSIWQATYVITEAEDGIGSDDDRKISNETIIDAANLNVSVTATDNAGNATTTADTTNATVDNESPDVTDNNIQIFGARGADGAFKVVDTVTVQWNNTSGGDNNDDISAVTVDFSAFGGGKAVAAAVFEQLPAKSSLNSLESQIPVDGQSNGVSIWRATYVITEAEDGIGSDDDRKISNETIIDAANLNVSVTATDNAGNATTTADTTNATVDNESPDVTDNNIQIFGASGTDGAFKVGDTVTVQWNNTSGGNNNDDISAVTVDFSAFGGGKAVAAAVFEPELTKSSLNSLDARVPAPNEQGNGVSIWQATYVITEAEDGMGSDDRKISNETIIDAANLNVSVTATDNAGNATTTADTTNATVDNSTPTISSSTPEDNDTGVALSENIVIDFSENIILGTGNIVISDGTDTITIDTAEHLGQLTVDGKSLTINPTNDLANDNATYSVKIASTAIVDDAGNAFAGINDTTSLDFTTKIAIDTSIVVFDLTTGKTSDHGEGQNTFASDESYDIYIVIDPSNQKFAADTFQWSGGANLGQDDNVYFVTNVAIFEGKNGGRNSNYATQALNDDINIITGKFTTIFTTINSAPSTTFTTVYNLAARLRSSGKFTRVSTRSNSVRNATLWNNTSSNDFNYAGVIAVMPANVLTSQGLA